jgi:glycosyltransferase involved in cell wall biosynthesis
VKVLHVGAHWDRQRRPPEALLQAWPTLIDVASAASGEEVNVRVLQAAAEDATLSAHGVTCEFVAERPFRIGRRTILVPRRLAKRAAEFSPDLVHFHGLSLALPLRWLQRALPGTPVLAQDHGGSPRSGWKVAVSRWGLATVDAVAFTSRAMARPFQETGCLGPRVAVFEILESSSRFTPGDQAVARTKTGLSGDPCVLWVGRLNSNKDPLAVLDAVSEALTRCPALRLWCCFAEAPLAEAVQARLAGEPRLRSCVQLVGQVPHDRLQDYYRAADIFVLGSKREGSGYALLEALASGLTPVVTDIPAFRRITRDGAVGALSPVGDSAAMSRALVEVASADRDVLRRKARTHFDQALSFDVVGKELRAAYRTIIGP